MLNLKDELKWILGKTDRTQVLMSYTEQVNFFGNNFQIKVISLLIIEI